MNVTDHGSDPLLFKGGEVNFNYLPGRGGNLKNKNGWKYGAGAGLLKREGLALFLFNFYIYYHYKVYHFYI